MTIVLDAIKFNHDSGSATQEHFLVPAEAAG